MYHEPFPAHGETDYLWTRDLFWSIKVGDQQSADSSVEFVKSVGIQVTAIGRECGATADEFY